MLKNHPVAVISSLQLAIGIIEGATSAPKAPSQRELLAGRLADPVKLFEALELMPEARQREVLTEILSHHPTALQEQANRGQR